MKRLEEKKEVCLPAPGRSGCYRTRIAAALRDQNHLQDRTEQGRKSTHVRGGRGQTVDSM